MLSKCCSEPAPDLEVLTPEDRNRFGKLVHDLRKQGKDLKSAQMYAYQLLLVEGLGDRINMIVLSGRRVNS